MPGSLQFARLTGQKRYKTYPDKVLLLNPLFTLCEFHQLLWPGMGPERQYHHASISQLFHELIGDRFRGGGDDDAVEGCAIGHAGKTVAQAHLDIAVAQRREPGARAVRQGPIALDADDLASESREHRGLIARAGADLEHAMPPLHAQLFGHIGHEIGLADGLAAGDRQRLIGIGAVGEGIVDEMLARHLVHGAQHRRIGDPALAQRKQELHAADVVVAGQLLGHDLGLLADFSPNAVLDSIAWRPKSLNSAMRRWNKSGRPAFGRPGRTIVPPICKPAIADWTM